MSTRALVATRKGLFTVERRASGWTLARVAFAGDNVPMALADARDGAIYAALGHGHFGVKLHRSNDGGETWRAIGVPTYPPKPEGVTDMDPVRRTPIEWSLELIWSLESGGPTRPGRLWAGTVPGGLFRSDDSGESWQLVRSLWDRPERQRWFGGGMDRPGIHSIVVDPGNNDKVSIGVSCGGVWHTADGGESWRVTGKGMRATFLPPEQADDPNQQDPHRLVTCAARSDHFWVQHHNGIFRSTDGGGSWTEITAGQPSTFGFPVAVHPKDPEVAWFVPAIKDEKRIPAEGRLVVSHTRDGGRSFVVLSRGLPQEWAYDLVYRHAFAIDDTGERLILGTTTGNLFLSDDGGQGWQAVSHHLPPIYATSFFEQEEG
jgi:hypothetical protein